jgi:Polysaccharide biosynthesis/export protein
MNVLLILLLFCSSCMFCCIDDGRRRPQIVSVVAPEVIEDNSSIEEVKEAVLPDIDPYAPLEGEFRFSVGDILEVSVYGEEEMEYRNVVIAPDGRLYYAFIDGIPVTGRTLPEVRQEVEVALKPYFSHPLVVIVPHSQQTKNLTSP